ncbi:MAG: ABC transporter permease subunit [Clostridiales bacterium]|jgi:putative aldouronate transport system permease protein|nr:ABC transporter permease subunit [Clostridiales bacterium]
MSDAASNHAAKLQPRSRGRGRKTLKAIWSCRYLYLLMAPALAWYIVYRYVPMLGTQIAFKNYSFSKGILGSPWAGLKHFAFLFSFPDFYNIVRNTILINIYNLLFEFPIPIILALMLNELRSLKFKKTIQTVVYFPHFLSWVIFGGLMIQFLSPNEGFVNKIIEFFGGDAIFFLSRTEYFRGIVVITNIIKETGWGAIIYLAALSGIDPALYEAAIIDGASRTQKLLYVTLPGIMNTIIIMLILRVGYLLDVGFEQIYVLYNAAVYEVGDVLSTFIYRIGIQDMQFSLTTAIGLFQSVIGFLLIWGTNRLARRYSDVSMW